MGDIILPLQGPQGNLDPRDVGAARDAQLISGNAFALRGLLDAWDYTCEDRYLAAALDYLDWCRACRSISGGLPESMPSSYQDEGCSLAYYVVASLMAFAATGRHRHLDEAENTLVNHTAMNQFCTGGFGHRLFAQEAVGGKGWQGWGGVFGSENPGCCSFRGAWALSQLGSYIVTAVGDTVELNLYADAELPHRDLRLAIRGDHPRMRSAAVTLGGRDLGRFALRLRVPWWAERVTLALNGRPMEGARAGGRVELVRTWSAGDTLELRFGSPPRAVPWGDPGAGLAGVFDGPICPGLSGEAEDVVAADRVEVDQGGTPVLSVGGRPFALREGGQAAQLRPIGEEWQSERVSDPNTVRILFRPTRSGASPGASDGR